MSEKALLQILEQENQLLDEILNSQTKVHIAVKTKDWTGLEDEMAKIHTLSLDFSTIDIQREKIMEEDSEIRADEKALMVTLHSKLLKSKIENQVMNNYIEVTRNFVQGILDNAVPQRRNILYSRDGKIVKREPESVVLNKVF